MACPIFSIDVSSTYTIFLPCIRCGISFTYKMKSNGSGTEPWRTPYLIPPGNQPLYILYMWLVRPCSEPEHYTGENNLLPVPEIETWMHCHPASNLCHCTDCETLTLIDRDYTVSTQNTSMSKTDRIIGTMLQCIMEWYSYQDIVTMFIENNIYCSASIVHSLQTYYSASCSLSYALCSSMNCTHPTQS
jgi:hypothetical protein